MDKVKTCTVCKNTKGGESMEMLKLKGVLTEKKKTYEDCAKALGISVTAFNDKINGKRSFSCWEATRLSRYLELSQTDRVSIFLG